MYIPKNAKSVFVLGELLDDWEAEERSECELDWLDWGRNLASHQAEGQDRDMHEGVEEQCGPAGGDHAVLGHPYLGKGCGFVDKICYFFIEIVTELKRRW